MRSPISCIVLLYVAICTPDALSQQIPLISGRNLQPIPYLILTSKEKAFIKSHPTILVGNEMDYPPFDFAVGGQPQGYSIDLLNLLATAIGLKLQYITRPTWEQLVLMYQQGQLDLLHSLSRSPEREKNGIFSESYYRMKSIFITRNNDPDIANFEQLYNKTVAVGAGWLQDEFLVTQYQQIKRLYCNNLPDMLDAVSNGKADATLEAESTFRYWQRKKGLGDLKMAGWAQQFDKRAVTFNFYAHNNAPELISMLNKALSVITSDKLQAMQTKWFGTPVITSGTAHIEFTEEELKYLTAKSEIRMCVLPDWMPYMRIDVQKAIEGIGADILKLIQARLGVKFVLYPTDTWGESLAAIRHEQCDILPMASDLPSRRDAMNFTKPYLTQPLVIVTLTKELFVKDTSEIGLRKIGIIESYSFREMLKQRYPRLDIIAVQNARDGLTRVRAGKIWGYVDAISSISYTLQQYPMPELKIAGRLEFDAKFSLASRKDAPLLASIMQKATATLTDEEKQAIISKWTAVRFELGFDYSLFWKFVAVAIAMLLGFYAWNRKLAKLNAEIIIKNAFIHQQHQIVVETLNQIAGLLNNSGQCFLSFTKNLKVNEEFSRECQRIFNRTNLDLSLPELLYPEDAERHSFVSKTLPLAIASADDELRYDAYISLLPAEYQLNNRYYKAEYKLLDHESMMLILTDVTDEKRLQERLALERLRLEFVVNALENRDDTIDVVCDFESFRSRTLPDLLFFEPRPEVLLSEVFRQIHTFKSLFAQASLPTMPAVLHALETRLGRLRNLGNNIDVNDIKRELGIVDLGAALEQDLAILREKLGNEYFNSEKEIHVPASRLYSLESEVSALCGSDSRLLELIRRLRYVPLKELLEPHFKAAQQLADKQQKLLAPIVYTGDKVQVDPDVYGAFCKTLVHIFRNAVDHGIEDADTRLLADKHEIGSINCQVRIAADSLTLIIADDGCGIDTALLRSKALANGLINVNAADAMSDAELHLLIFADGLSTRQEVTTISGRGVGLSAVQQELKHLYGTISVHSVSNQGTRIAFTLPHKSLACESSQAELLTQERVDKFLAPLPRVVKTFYEEHLKLAVTLGELQQKFTVNMLLDFTVLVPLGSGLQVALGMSIARPLLLEMTHRFDPEFSIAEVAELADSVGAEIANTIFGNVTVYFTHFIQHVAMGTPDIVNYSEAIVKIGNNNFYGFTGTCNAGKFIVFCALTE